MVRTLTDDAWEVRGVIRDGVFRGDTDAAEVAATYGYGNEEALCRGSNNHYVDASVVSASAVEDRWGDGWEVAYTMDDVSEGAVGSCTSVIGSGCVIRHRREVSTARGGTRTRS